MKEVIHITENYLYIPVKTGFEECLISIFDEKTGDKLYEFLIPVNPEMTENETSDFYGEIPVSHLKGTSIIVSGNVPEAFGHHVRNQSKMDQTFKDKPQFHFNADTGWTNDPNGLIFKDGIYHLYFQYNPFNISWQNMTWGHAVSTDLLHWEIKDSVMFPDEKGTMFSGCALDNQRGMKDLPKDAMLFYYTVAGNANEWSKGRHFEQYVAYSIDGGDTLIKIPECEIPAIGEFDRDPKVSWHEETKGYFAPMYLQNNDFVILRSEDLKHWEVTDRFTPDNEAWECPDLFKLQNEAGESKWFFWSADGFYYPGSFDGYKFIMDGQRGHAYLNKYPYAAQTYWGTPGRVISIPWLRFPNDGRPFTSTYGIPAELSYTVIDGTYMIKSWPVREFFEHLRPVSHEEASSSSGFVFEGRLADSCQMAEFRIHGSILSYDPKTGLLCFDDEQIQISKGAKDLLFIVDNSTLEVFIDKGLHYGTFIIDRNNTEFVDNNAILSTKNEYVIA